MHFLAVIVLAKVLKGCLDKDAHVRRVDSTVVVVVYILQLERQLTAIPLTTMSRRRLHGGDI